MNIEDYNSHKRAARRKPFQPAILQITFFLTASKTETTTRSGFCTKRESLFEGVCFQRAKALFFFVLNQMQDQRNTMPFSLFLFFFFVKNVNAIHLRCRYFLFFFSLALVRRDLVTEPTSHRNHQLLHTPRRNNGQWLRATLTIASTSIKAKAHASSHSNKHHHK